MFMNILCKHYYRVANWIMQRYVLTMEALFALSRVSIWQKHYQFDKGTTNSVPLWYEELPSAGFLYKCIAK